MLGADGATFSSTVPSRAALGYSLWANTEIKFTPFLQGLAQVAQKIIPTLCKTKADGPREQPRDCSHLGLEETLTVSDCHQEFLTGLTPPAMGKWSQNSCCYLWQCFLGLDILWTWRRLSWAHRLDREVKEEQQSSKVMVCLHKPTQLQNWDVSKSKVMPLSCEVPL